MLISDRITYRERKYVNLMETIDVLQNMLNKPAYIDQILLTTYILLKNQNSHGRIPATLSLNSFAIISAIKFSFVVYQNNWGNPYLTVYITRQF